MKIVGGKKGKLKKKEEKIEICLVEEKEGEERKEGILPVWEEVIGGKSRRRQFHIRGKEKGRAEEKYDRTCGLLEDFPNLSRRIAT